MARLFVALELPPGIREKLVTCRSGIEGARWQGEEQMHLTLRFIGESDRQQELDIRAALAGVRFAPFDVTLDGIGLFGKARAPRAIWAGVAGAEPLKHLHQKIDQCLASVGFPPEERKFVPHVTLARLKGRRAKRVPAFLDHYAGLRLAPFRVNSFALFSSHLGRGGAEYRVEETFPARSDPVPA